MKEKTEPTPADKDRLARVYVLMQIIERNTETNTGAAAALMFLREVALRQETAIAVSVRAAAESLLLAPQLFNQPALEKLKAGIETITQKMIKKHPMSAKDAAQPAPKATEDRREKKT